ncbi:SRPBCC family protein [Nocardia sp. NPDC055321]
MGQVSASSSIVVTADPKRTLDAIADYESVRPRILSSHYRDYKVVEGGKGAGTVVEWTLQATEKRQRNVRAAITVSDSMVTERDSNSSMVTTWTVTPEGNGSLVTVRTSWKGAGGIGGIFEGIFAPLGLKKIQAEVLEKLKQELAV